MTDTLSTAPQTPQEAAQAARAADGPGNAATGLAGSVRAPNAWQLEKALSIAQQAVIALQGQSDRAYLDADEALDAIKAEGVDLPTIMRCILLAATEAEANAEAVKLRMDELAQRKARFDRQRETWRNTALMILQALPEAFPGGKFKDPLVNASIGHSRPGVVVTDIDKLEARFVKTEKSPILSLINTAITDGEVVDGASRRNGSDYLIIRTT